MYAQKKKKKKRQEYESVFRGVEILRDFSEDLESNCSFDGGFIPECFQTLVPLFDREDLVHDAVDLDLSRVEVADGSGELVDLGEATDDGDFVAN